ncbi:cupin [Pseudonocardia sp. D17]|nr:cupin [Pseudonocardia sp. D17]
MRETDVVSAPALATLLGLAPHPEGGWYRRTWTAPTTTSTPHGPRPSATAILYLLDDVSAWHRVRSTELWCWHSGSPVGLATGGDGPGPGAPVETVLGPPGTAAGTLPQREIPPGVWQTARLLGAEPALVSCVVSPGFDFADFELAPSAS